jgi:hypothetical protein
MEQPDQNWMAAKAICSHPSSARPSRFTAANLCHLSTNDMLEKNMVSTKAGLPQKRVCRANA